MAKPSSTKIELPFGMSLNVDGKVFQNEVKKMLSVLENNPSYIESLVNETKDLLKEGIDLDARA